MGKELHPGLQPGIKTFEQECAQAYVTGKGTGTWKKNCIQVYNQSYKTFEQKCNQTFIQR